QQGRVWTYQGHFGMRRVSGDWKVIWAPSVINPNLGPGERLAVVTRFPPRSAVLDAQGNPLQLPAPAYALGVWPERLSNPAATAQAFASRTRLQAGQVLGQITAAPPHPPPPGGRGSVLPNPPPPRRISPSAWPRSTPSATRACATACAPSR